MKELEGKLFWEAILTYGGEGGFDPAIQTEETTYELGRWLSQFKEGSIIRIRVEEPEQ